MFQSLTSPSLIFIAISVIVSLVIHEFSHAVAATALGDPTARAAGRLTLNPLVHLEPLGLLMILFAPIGWAKPVPIHPVNFKNPRLGLIVTSLAGPLSNFVLACGSLLLLRALPNVDVGTSFAGQLLNWGFVVNVNLFVFNLIPIPPLDGSRIVSSLLPARQAVSYQRFEIYGPFILLLVFMVPAVQQILFTPLFNSTQRIIAGWFGFM